MVEGILVGMRWLGLDWDEGPFYQSQRLPLYTATAEKLLASRRCLLLFLHQGRIGAAPRGSYRRWASAHVRWPLPHHRSVKKRCGERIPGTPALFVSPFRKAGAPALTTPLWAKLNFRILNWKTSFFCVRMASPLTISALWQTISTCGSPTLFAGPTTSPTRRKQVLQYQALGAELPVFAHVPLILGPDKTRLSKRHGATSVISYKDLGIVPEAFRNFLSLLGWSPGAAGKDADGKDREIFPQDELIKLFSLEGISKSNAVFDNDKLAWFNTEYIRAYPVEKLLPLIREEWERRASRQIAQTKKSPPPLNC